MRKNNPTTQTIIDTNNYERTDNRDLPIIPIHIRAEHIQFRTMPRHDWTSLKPFEQPLSTANVIHKWRHNLLLKTISKYQHEVQTVYHRAHYNNNPYAGMHPTDKISTQLAPNATSWTYTNFSTKSTFQASDYTFSIQ